MTSWSGSTSNGAYSLVIEKPALASLGRLCSASGFVETGGVLVGRYSLDLTTAVVVEATPAPRDSERRPSRFTRGAVGLREMLRRRWSANPRAYYLGEWHFHPVQHVIPSSIDFSQMQLIARAAEYQCDAPIMVILGMPVDALAPHSLRAFVCPAADSPHEFVEVSSNRLRLDEC